MRLEARLLAAYSFAVIIVAGLWGWRAPLTFDEAHFYVPSAKFFAERFPALPLDYPMPMPPLALYIQGALWRCAPSVMMLRVVSTLAALAGACLMTSWLRPNSWRAATLMLAILSFPTMLLNAFTLKHHNLVFLFCAAALIAWERKHVALTATALLAAVLTSQIALACVGLIIFLSLQRYASSGDKSDLISAFACAATAVPLIGLVVAWGWAPRPPSYVTTFIDDPGIGLRPAQVTVLLLMIAVWVAPSIVPTRWYRWILLLLPVVVVALLVTRGELVPRLLAQIAGPVSTVLSRATAGRQLPQLLAAGVILLAGVAGLAAGARERAGAAFLVWTGGYLMLMMVVPFYFESYYALYVAVTYLLLREKMMEQAPIAVVHQLLVITAGAGYTLSKLVSRA